MKRSLAGAVLLALALPSCKSGGPRGGPVAAPPGPDPLRPYVGDVRLFRAKADEKNVTVDAKKPLSGPCDMAVRVRSARFDKGAALFALETVGRPRVGGHEPRCRSVQPDIQLRFAGLTPASPDVAQRVDAVLQTPEAYLGSRGITFNLPAAPAPPKEIATSDQAGTPAESVLGKKVTAWPRLLLAIHPFRRGASEATRQESEVEFDAVVGTDGRLYDPQVKTPLSADHREVVLRALSRWRFEPAKTANGAIASRLNSRMALRIY